MALILVVAGGVAALRLAFDPLPRAPMGFAGDWPFEADPEIGFVPARTARTEILTRDGRLDHVIRTDSRRLRIDDSGQPTPDDIDVLIVGCSFAWGHGLDYEATFAARSGHDLDIIVANAAVAGYGGVQALQAIERYADLQPHTVVYAFILDHLRRNLSPCAPSYAPFCTAVSHLATDDAGTFTLRGPNPELDRSAVAQRYLREIGMVEPPIWRSLLWRARLDFERWRVGAPPMEEFDLGAAIPQHRFVLDAMLRATQRENARLLVLAIPYLHHGTPAPLPTELHDAIPRGAYLLDLAPEFARFRKDRPDVALTLADGIHPNATAHEIIATALAAWFRSEVGSV